MTLGEALQFLKAETDNRPIGYWKFGDVYIFNTEPPKSKTKLDVAEPAQFAVRPSGDVAGTNPLQYDLSLRTMKKL